MSEKLQTERTAMFRLSLETTRILSELPREQLGEVMHSLFCHYLNPDADYTGRNPLVRLAYRFASGEMDRYMGRRRESKWGSFQPNVYGEQTEVTSPQSAAQREQAEGISSETEVTSESEHEQTEAASLKTEAPSKTDEEQTKVTSAKKEVTLRQNGSDFPKKATQDQDQSQDQSQDQNHNQSHNQIIYLFSDRQAENFREASRRGCPRSPPVFHCHTFGWPARAVNPVCGFRQFVRMPEFKELKSARADSEDFLPQTIYSEVP